MIRSQKLTVVALAILAGAMAVPCAQAQNTSFELGNLFLGFRATGGVGSSAYVSANIGDSALTFRDATTNLINITNIGSQLTAQFGSTWYDRTDIFTGAGASFQNDEFGDPTVRNGDDFNTLYVTKRRTTLGTAGTAGSNAPSTIGDPLTGAGQQQASNLLVAAGLAFEAQSGAVVTIANSFSPSDFDDSNTTLTDASWGGVFAGGTSAAFGAGTVGTFGGINAEAILDLYRIDPSNGVSSFEGSIVIDNLGNVSFIVEPAAIPEPATLAFGMLVGAVGLMRRRRTQVA